MNQAATPAEVRGIAMRNDLRTADPYDIWKTSIGFHCKNLFNRNRLLGIVPAGILEVFDLFINNRARWCYATQEYPIVRALAAQSLMNLYTRNADPALLAGVRGHLRWLTDNAASTGKGIGWGLGFKYAVQAGMVYPPNAAFSTMTPYALEAFDEYFLLAPDDRNDALLMRIYRFFSEDLVVMNETERWIATSYTNSRDRVVINALSYTMYATARLLRLLPDEERAGAELRIRKLFAFIADHQRADGSWLYAPTDSSFIDCFHSCIVVKNIIKSGAYLKLEGADELARRGYDFIRNAFQDCRSGLYRRFALRNKPGLIALDLYDNAEAMSLAIDMHDLTEAARLQARIAETFIRRGEIWSRVSVFGTRHDRGSLRWAVMPYFFALTRLWAETISRESSCAG